MIDAWTRRRLADHDAATVLASLRAWEPSTGCGWQLQPGDLGWALRFEPEIRDEQIRVWWDRAGELAAVVLCDAPTSARCAVNPAYLHDESLADEVLTDLSQRLARTDGGPWIDPPPGPGALTRALLAAGFEPDPVIWLHLWRELVPGRDAEPDGVLVRSVTDTDLAERVALQRAAFPGSSLTVERYRRVRAVPGFRPELDLVSERDGMLTAFCLAWLGPPGGTGLLEPTGTHPTHRRNGHGRATITEAFRRLAAAGATGVSVLAPVSNRPAIELYRSVGMAAVAERRSYWPIPRG
ncbi:MAG: GNAT family N-acetyltransferase [Actinocatenispora sp.]